ncbi:MAG: EAL domain-containing protein [Phycisphaerales bacterium]
MTRVLLIEHDPLNRDRLALALRQARLEVRSAGDAPGARALLRECRPTVIVCRAQMPGFPLEAVVAEARAEPSARHAGIVALLPEGELTAAAVRAAIQAGADDALALPVETADLVQAVDARRRRLETQMVATRPEIASGEAIDACIQAAPRPTTVVLLGLEDAAAVAATAGAPALRQLEELWRARLRALAPSGAPVFDAPHSEALVVLPPHTPHQRALLSAFCGTGQAPAIVAGRDMRLRAAAGIVTIAPGEETPTATVLIQRCRYAMQGARRAGHPRVQVYDADEATRSLDHVQLATLLQHALEGGGFRLLYQPRVCVATGELLGVESLIRWTLPSTGEQVPAKTLLEVAQEAGLLDEIGGWGLREACRQCAQWWNAGLEIPVAVNVAPTQFRRGDLVDEVRLALRESGIPGRMLMIEVQESALREAPADLRDQLEAVRVCGVRVALDDFGTGIESLNLLRRFPLDEMKVDHSIVSRLPGSCEDRATMEIALRHARSLGLQCTAVGVESAAQWSYLVDRGWDGAQGWFVAQPLPGSEIPGFKRHEPGAIAAAHEDGERAAGAGS